MQTFAGKVAAITGAAEGIGRAIAARAAAEGMVLALSDINAGSLEKTAAYFREQGAVVLACPTDVSKPDQVEAFAAATLEKFGKVHLLVNNAGVSLAKTVWETTPRDWDWVMGVNFHGVTNGLRAFLPRMMAQGDEGHVVNVASLAGLVSLPGLAAYNASKFAVVTVSEGLFHDLALRGAKIGVTVLCPGWVRTGIASSERNRGDGGQAEPARADPTAMKIGAAIRQAVDKGMAPEHVAEKLFAAIRAGAFYCLPHEGTEAMAVQRARDIAEGRKPTLFTP